MIESVAVQDSLRRLLLQSKTPALCTVVAVVAVGASAVQARSEEAIGQHAGATPTAPPYVEARPGEALPDLLLEDGHGQRFRLSDMRGRPLALTLGFAEWKWEHGVLALRAIAGHRDRAAVLHLTVVPTTHTDDAPGAPPVPARDIAQQHREDTAWLAGVGEDPRRSVRRLPRGPNDGPRPWRFRGEQAPLIVISDADGVVQQIILRDTAGQARVNGFALLDAAITCAGGGPPIYDDSRKLVASGRLEACAASDRSSGDPRSARRGRPPAVAPPPPSPSRRSLPD